MPVDNFNVPPETVLNFFHNVMAAISGLGSLPNIISTLISTTITTIFVPVYAVVEYVLPGKADIAVVFLGLFLLYIAFTIAIASMRVAWRMAWGFVRFVFVLALMSAAGLLYFNGLEMDVLGSIQRGRAGLRSALDRQDL
jgi:hypothetical protein